MWKYFYKDNKKYLGFVCMKPLCIKAIIVPVEYKKQKVNCECGATHEVRCYKKNKGVYVSILDV